MRILNSCIFLIIFFAFSFCKKEHAPDCITATGPDVSSIREVGEFHGIDLNSDMDLYIYKGSEFKVEVVGGKYIMDKIAASVQSGTLVLENNNRFNFVRGYKRRIKINVTVPTLHDVFNYAVGTIYFDANYSQDSLINIGARSSGDIYVNGTFGSIYTSSHGNGDLYFNGKAQQLQIYTNGTNFTHAENLDVFGYIFVDLYSIGDVFLNLNSNNQLDYNIWDEGNIYYSGNPKGINQTNTSTAKGKAIHR